MSDLGRQHRCSRRDVSKNTLDEGRVNNVLEENLVSGSCMGRAGLRERRLQNRPEVTESIDNLCSILSAVSYRIKTAVNIGGD